MGTFRVSNARIVGLVAALPQQVMTVADFAGAADFESIKKTCASLGIEQRPTAPFEVCASDLCAAASERVLERTGWARESIDVVIFLSQTPDYALPATACTLQQRLGLSTGCAAFDVNLGCSGYPYGLWLMSQLISAGQMKRGLLLVGDTLSRKVSPQDSATAHLFGDSGTATAIEFDPAAPTMDFVLGTDGRGAEHLIVPAGGSRQPHGIGTSDRTARADNGIRSDEDISMNGPEVFSFTLREVPGLAKQTLAAAGWSLDDVDSVVLHQANTFMLQHLAKRMKLSAEKMPLSLRDFGNTSCATIPVTMAARLSEQLTSSSQKLMLLGFGVGFSWGGAAITCGPLACADVIRFDTSDLTGGAASAPRLSAEVTISPQGRVADATSPTNVVDEASRATAPNLQQEAA